MVNKKILVIDLVLIVGSLMIIAGVVGYARPLVIAPVDDLVTMNSSVLFVFEKGERILIDDNLGFSSPQIYEVKDDLVINLKPGFYYWKVEGALDSDIRQLTIQSYLDLKLKEAQNGDFELVNAGNAELNVEVYEDGELKENVVVGIDKSQEFDGDKFVGRQNE